MIYRIADPAVGGRGVVGIYPGWQDDGERDGHLLRQTRDQDISVLFTRNYSGVFLRRIRAHLGHFGRYVDLVYGWEPEKLRMFFLPLNPEVEARRLSAMHFNTMKLIDQVRAARQPGAPKRADLFFATSERPDQLKNVPLLVRLLASTRLSLSVTGYGRLAPESLRSIRANRRLRFQWKGKAEVTSSEQRLGFLGDLARSRCLLVTSRAEGYCRLVGEALLLSVPVVMHAEIQSENWAHLSADNCRLFNSATFDRCLEEVLSRTWRIIPPELEDGNHLLRRHIIDYFQRRGEPPPSTWYPLGYGALNDRVLKEPP